MIDTGAAYDDYCDEVVDYYLAEWAEHQHLVTIGEADELTHDEWLAQADRPPSFDAWLAARILDHEQSAADRRYDQLKGN